MSVGAITKNKTKMIQMAITFLIPIAIALIPPQGVFTYQMKMAIAITLWMLLWSAFDLSNLAVPAIIWPALLVILQVVEPAVAFGSWIGTTMYGAIGCMLLANVLNGCGLLQRVAYWVAVKCGGSFNKSVYAIFFATFAVSIVTFASGSVVCAVLSFSFVAAMGLIKKKEGAIIMMAGMLGASTVRMFLYYPVTMGPLMQSVRAVEPEFTVNFTELFKFNWPVLIFCLLFIWFMTFIGKTKHSQLGEVGDSKQYFQKKLDELGPMTGKEKKALVGVLVILVWIITNPLHGLDCMYPFIFVPFVLCMPGIDVGSSKEIEDVPWSTILFFGSCLAIGSVCGAVGITDLIASVATPMLSGLGTVGLLVGVLIFGVLANFAMTPVAMLAGFCGMLYSIAVNLGVDPLAVIFTFNHSTDMVFLPYEYLTFLVFYALGGMTMGQFFKYQALKNIVYMIFFVAIMIPYWYLVGLI